MNTSLFALLFSLALNAILFFSVLWWIEWKDRQYWQSEAERYWEMWDRAAWKKPTTNEEQRP